MHENTLDGQSTALPSRRTGAVGLALVVVAAASAATAAFLLMPNSQSTPASAKCAHAASVADVGDSEDVSVARAAHILRRSPESALSHLRLSDDVRAALSDPLAKSRALAEVESAQKEFELLIGTREELAIAVARTQVESGTFVSSEPPADSSQDSYTLVYTPEGPGYVAHMPGSEFEYLTTQLRAQCSKLEHTITESVAAR